MMPIHYVDPIKTEHKEVHNHHHDDQNHDHYHDHDHDHYHDHDHDHDHDHYHDHDHDHYHDRYHDDHHHGHNDHGHYHHDDYHHHGHHYHDDHHHHGHHHHDDYHHHHYHVGHHHHGHHYHVGHHYHGHHHDDHHYYDDYHYPINPFDPIFGRSPVFYMPQSATNFLACKHGRLPQSYISYNGLDIGVNAEIDDWRDFLAMQNGLKALILLLLLLILAMPIVGCLYGWFCGRCRNCRTGSKRTCYGCGILLAVAALLMFLFLFLAIMSARQLTKGLEKFGPCSQRSLYRYPYRRMRLMCDPNYKNFLERIEVQSDATQAGDHAEAIKDLSEVLKNMHAAKLILEEFQNELPVAKGLAIRFRDALRVVKENLKEFLTSQCNQEKCRDFYRDNEIRMLDEGCLRFDRIPSTEALTNSINEILSSNFVNYPLVAAQQIAKAYNNHTNNLLDTIKKDLHKDDQNLHEKYKASLVELRVKKIGPAIAIRHLPAAALRRKLGPSWYGNTLGMLLVLMILPVFLLIALVVKLFNPNVGRGLLCAFLTAAFTLFSIPLVLVLFFLVHGFLTYDIFCAGLQVPEKRITIYNRPIFDRPNNNPANDKLPNNNTTNANPPNASPPNDNQPVLRSRGTLNPPDQLHEHPLDYNPPNDNQPVLRSRDRLYLSNDNPLDDNPPDDNPPVDNPHDDNPQNDNPPDDNQPVLRSADTLYLPDNNPPVPRSGDTLQRFYVNMKRDIRQSLDKLEGAHIPGNLSSIHIQAMAEDQEILRNKLFSYNSSEFTQHMCRELVPVPKPGPLPELISRLANLTRNVGSPPFLLNQTIRLQVADKELGRPLAEIIQRLLGKLKQLDHLLSVENESFATYSSRLLEKIKQFQRRDFVGFGMDNETKESMKSLAQARHYHGYHGHHHHGHHRHGHHHHGHHHHGQHHHNHTNHNHTNHHHHNHHHHNHNHTEDHHHNYNHHHHNHHFHHHHHHGDNYTDDYHIDDHHHDHYHHDHHAPYPYGSFDPYFYNRLALNRYLIYKDLCGSIANPMNAMWFWLLPFALTLLPALCCSHYLRCYCRCCRNVCEAPCAAQCAAPCADPSADPCSASSAASCAPSSAASCAAYSAAPCAAPCGVSCASPCAAPCASPCVNPCCTLPIEFQDCTHCRYLPVIDETNVDQLNFNMNL